MTKRVIYRDSETGRITTKEAAEQSPATTEREVVKVPTPKKKK
jgi:hypothetical protein